jgi:hypothetical protein
MAMPSVLSNFTEKGMASVALWEKINVKKIYWGKCSNAWKGHLKGKEGYPTITLEALANH